LFTRTFSRPARAILAAPLAALLGVDVAAPAERSPASPLCAILDTPRGRVELRAPDAS